MIRMQFRPGCPGPHHTLTGVKYEGEKGGKKPGDIFQRDFNRVVVMQDGKILSAGHPHLPGTTPLLFFDSSSPFREDRLVKGAQKGKK